MGENTKLIGYCGFKEQIINCKNVL